MNSENQKFAGIAFILRAAYLKLNEEKKGGIKKRKINRKVWVRKWIEKRTIESMCVKLLPELQAESPTNYRNLLRMRKEDSDFLLSLIGLKIKKSDTHMRASIPAEERLAFNAKR